MKRRFKRSEIALLFIMMPVIFPIMLAMLTLMAGTLLVLLLVVWLMTPIAFIFPSVFGWKEE